LKELLLVNYADTWSGSVSQQFRRHKTSVKKKFGILAISTKRNTSSF